MHIHILGICGTFMGGIAKLAIEAGHQVSGCDQNVYPPMSTQLEHLGVQITFGYAPQQLDKRPDLVVIGNALSRGNPCVEAVLEQGIPYTSGPQWLHDHVLQGRWVLAVAGTHGKTTTASILAWLLEANDLAPGFLIGGVPRNFNETARIGQTPFFVVEADEYDSAFFDKRSKFVHYSPRTVILNNLEYDHADIFPNLEAIERQFHHLVRTVPGQGQIIVPKNSTSLSRVLQMGCWSELVYTGAEGQWQIKAHRADWGHFGIYLDHQCQGEVQWSLIGEHNAQNALMAVIAARHVGVRVQDSLVSLQQFLPPKRRLEQIGHVAGVTIYDDFAHHPTAIAATLAALRAQIGPDTPLTAIIEPRSNTMKLGVHQQTLVESLAAADRQLIFHGSARWNVEQLFEQSLHAHCYQDIESLIDEVVTNHQVGEHIVLMSNGRFAGLGPKLVAALQAKG